MQIHLSRAWIHTACDKKLFYKMKAPNFTIKSNWITIKLIFTFYFIFNNIHILALSYKVCGYTRHDTLYEEARPEDIQNRGKLGQKGVHIGTFLSSINEDKTPLVSKMPDGWGSQQPSLDRGISKIDPRSVDLNPTTGERDNQRRVRQTDTSVSDWLLNSTTTPGKCKLFFFFFFFLHM